MSLFFSRDANITSLDAIARAAGVRLRSDGAAAATPETALRHSAVWACLRVRADLISTTPLDVFRQVGGVQVEVPKPPLLASPGGPDVGLEEWLYSSQMDLDRFGNCFGIIVERDGLGFPARVDLVPAQDVTVHVKDGRIDFYRVAGQRYEPQDIWHERQFTVPGLPVGLSPVAYAAWSIGTYLSAQEFALDWFSSGAAPAGHLRNTLKPTIERDEAVEVKERWKQAIAGRDVFVTGRDWEYQMNAVPANTVMFLDEMKYGVGDVCRFFGVPGDVIEAEVSTGSVTYANVGQRMLQLLVINLGPAFIRREKALSRAMPTPRFVKFATDALMRMDPEGKSKKLIAEVAGRLLAPSEARALENRQPFTDDQVAEFDRLFGNPNKQAPQVKQASSPAITVHTPPVTVAAPEVDARSFVTVQAPPVPEVHNNFEHVIDARTTVEPAAVTVDARSEVMPPAVTVNVEPAPPAEPVLTRKRIETDDKGRIVGVIEERA